MMKRKKKKFNRSNIHSLKHHHFNTILLILLLLLSCVIVGLTASHNTITDTSGKKLTSKTKEQHQYRVSFIEFLLDPKLPSVLQSSDDNYNLNVAQSNLKPIDALIEKRSVNACALLSNHLSGDQVKFCQKHHDVLESILPQVIETTEKECKRITKNLKWNCSALRILFEKSSSLAYTREAALVRSILNASMMYLIAKVCSQNNHKSCGCLSNYGQYQTSEPKSIPIEKMEIFLDMDKSSLKQENQTSRSPRTTGELSLSDLSKLDAGSPIRLINTVQQRQGCMINSAFASAFTKVFIDFDDTKNLNRAYKILNGDPVKLQGSRYSHIRRIDNDERDLAHIKWTKSAINLHNNQVGRRIVRETIQKRCRCHGLSGSCQLQTCWEQLLDISIITSRLKFIYLHQSMKAFSKNLGSPERPDLYLARVPENHDHSLLPELLSHQGEHKDPQMNRVNSEELLYIYDSPEYCEPQPRLGHHGTKGRPCRPSSNITRSYIESLAFNESIGELNESRYDGNESQGSCEQLCCDRGHQRELILDMVPCRCRFRFCCHVECDNCLRQIEQYYCK